MPAASFVTTAGGRVPVTSFRTMQVAAAQKIFTTFAKEQKAGCGAGLHLHAGALAGVASTFSARPTNRFSVIEPAAPVGFWS